jgi:CheY-like chemotaxis protein
MLCAVFEAQEWETIEASDGEEGLEQVENHRPGLIILDLMMPVMNGFTFAEKLRQNPAYHNIPVIVLTAMVLDERDRRRLSPYVQGIIEKGGTPNYLYNLLTQAKTFIN